jgi:hypothetical protein
LEKDTLEKDTLEKDTLEKDTLEKDTLEKDTLEKYTLSYGFLTVMLNFIIVNVVLLNVMAPSGCLKNLTGEKNKMLVNSSLPNTVERIKNPNVSFPRIRMYLNLILRDSA